MNYQETEQKKILRSIERGLLALLVIDPETRAYEVIYSDEAYKSYPNRYSGKDFFHAWQTTGLSLIYEPDRLRMKGEISCASLQEAMRTAGTFLTRCRFFVRGNPAWCAIKVVRNPVDPETWVLGIRNIDQELRHELQQTEALEELLRRESIYREAILANSAGYMEVNLSRNRITSKIYDHREDWMPVELTLPELGDPVPYDAFEIWWGQNMVLSDAEEFLSFSNCAHLISCFDRGERIVSIECKAKTVKGEANICRETYYLSKDTQTGDILAICVLYDLTRQQQREQDMQALQETLKQMRMKNFISQMHPHFLYNALSSIREIVLTDPEYGADMLYDFTTHLRASIRAMSNDNKIWFSQELENIKAYVNIEQMRFGDRLKVVYDIQAADFQIIPLSIQPIVENAIKHGLYEKGAEGGTVAIRTREWNDGVEIIVADDGIGFDPEAIRREILDGKRDSTGLFNLIFRLENMMQATVELRSRPGEGTTAVIRIPEDTQSC